MQWRVDKICASEQEQLEEAATKLFGWSWGSFFFLSRHRYAIFHSHTSFLKLHLFFERICMLTSTDLEKTNGCRCKLIRSLGLTYIFSILPMSLTPSAVLRSTDKRNFGLCKPASRALPINWTYIRLYLLPVRLLVWRQLDMNLSVAVLISTAIQRITVIFKADTIYLERIFAGSEGRAWLESSHNSATNCDQPTPLQFRCKVPDNFRVSHPVRLRWQDAGQMILPNSKFCISLTDITFTHESTRNFKVSWLKNSARHRASYSCQGLTSMVWIYILSHVDFQVVLQLPLYAVVHVKSCSGNWNYYYSMIHWSRLFRTYGGALLFWFWKISMRNRSGLDPSPTVSVEWMLPEQIMDDYCDLTVLSIESDSENLIKKSTAMG